MKSLSEKLEMIRDLILEAKGGAGDEGFLTMNLDAAEYWLIRAETQSEAISMAAKCALGHLTGNMDGDMDLGDPVEMLRTALLEKSQ